jgi:hypothetical protein
MVGLIYAVICLQNGEMAYCIPGGDEPGGDEAGEEMRDSAKELTEELEILGGEMRDSAKEQTEELERLKEQTEGLERVKEEHVKEELSKLETRLFNLHKRLIVGEDEFEQQKQERLRALEELEYLEKLLSKEEKDKKDLVIFGRIIVAKLRYSEEPVKGLVPSRLLKTA